MKAVQLEISGIVQGVGFRPFIYQLAARLDIKGEVANTSRGVTIHIEGEERKIDFFLEELVQKRPPLSRITEIQSHPSSVIGFKDFSIVKSKPHTVRSTLIAPDTSLCSDCLAELFDPKDRRYLYPFINCTNCGPRYSIISDIPYDRPNTSMKHFQMCGPCQKEYDDPANRRFHAQPNACDRCGPSVSLYDASGKKIETDHAIEEAARLLKNGYILAVKGLGGFQLAADAENDKTIHTLRKRKKREEKPFALMAYNEEKINEFAHIQPEESKLLNSFQRPIILLIKKIENSISAAVSPRNRYFGTMLPYTPLHYILLRSGFAALVMTSANISDEPIAIENKEAISRLSNIADFFLMHDRDIYVRSDDSIMIYSANTPRMIRRSRGYVPVPISIKNSTPHILACGAELKNTFCLTKGREAFLSQHIGDLKNQQAFAFFKNTIMYMKHILDIEPEIIAYDLHPDYLSTQYALDVNAPKKIGVQHHHAHIVSCLAENRVDGPVIGLSFDGTGFGSDGNIWGGEVLVAEAGSFSRVAHMAYAPMPGSAAAIKEPWRMGVSYLYHVFGEDIYNLHLPLFNAVKKDKIEFIVEMISKGVNSPLTSSLGRLFDGVAAIVGLRSSVYFEGQAAMELEMVAHAGHQGIYPYEWNDNNVFTVAFAPIIRGIVADIHAAVPTPIISAKFHATLIRLFTELCDQIRNNNGLDRIALSGGVFQNSILLSGLCRELEEKGFSVYTHTNVPANDGGISLGQAVAAFAMTR